MTDEIELPETLTATELLLFSIERRIGRIADALERNEHLTLHVERLADALGAIALTLDCATEAVEGKDGVARCVIRTHKSSPNILSFQDEAE
jgi:hypothetical protein